MLPCHLFTLSPSADWLPLARLLPQLGPPGPARNARAARACRVLAANGLARSVNHRWYVAAQAELFGRPATAWLPGLADQDAGASSGFSCGSDLPADRQRELWTRALLRHHAGWHSAGRPGAWEDFLVEDDLRLPAGPVPIRTWCAARHLSCKLGTLARYARRLRRDGNRDRRGRRPAGSRSTGPGNTGYQPVDQRLCEQYAALALHPNFQRRLRGRRVPMHARAWKDTRDLAGQLGLPMRSPSWWRCWFDARYPEFARGLARGKRGFEADNLPKIRRDNTTIDPLEWVSLDGHVLNILCRVPDARLGWRQARPVLTGVLDVRTRLMTGWDLRSTEASDGILAGVKMTIRDYGCPRHYYADNGKAYKASVGSRVRRRLLDDPRIGGICIQTGAERHNAIPYHGWAKMIESWWRLIIDEFERYWPSFCGNVGSRPEQADKLRTDQLPTVDEVRAGLQEFFPAFHATARDCLGGLTPTLAYEQFAVETRKLEPDVLDFLCCRLAGPRTVRADGVTWNKVLYGHFDIDVWKLQRRKVWLRIDPERADAIWLCDESGAPLCRASNRKLTGATQEEVRDAARTRSRMRKIAAEYASARDFLLDTNIQQIMRLRRTQAEASQAVARAELPAPQAPAVTIVRPDLVGPVKHALAGVASTRRRFPAVESPSTSVPSGLEQLAKFAQAEPPPPAMGLPPPSYTAFRSAPVEDDEPASYAAFREAAG